MLVIPNVVPSSSTSVALMMEGLRSSGTSLLTRAIRRNILEDGVLHREEKVFDNCCPKRISDFSKNARQVN
jgi:hypothetical protein